MRRIVTLVCIILAGIHLSEARAQNSSGRPNIVVILVDDMGFSDLGSYGSEISTPNIDKLAFQGLRFTNFYNTGRCCPTRASLMTGLYPHQTGLGWMDGVDQKTTGYKGEISNQCVTIPEVLKPAGYSSYMSGKWHVVANAKDTMPKYNWPMQRGFDRFFGILTGAANYFAPTNLISGNKSIKPSKDFYMTDALTDTAVKYIDDHVAKKSRNPFFLYLAYNAPHFPIHAKEEDINKYLPVYRVGWDKIRERRFSKQQQLGLFDEPVKLSDRDSEVPAWDSIPESERSLWIKRMAVYAGAVDCIDRGVGRLIEKLKEHKVYENTLIVFLSDNGGCAEYISNNDKSIEALGGPSSNESYRINWANASNTPFRLFKSRMHEGGIRTPFIVHWPEKIKEDRYVRTPSHIIDLMPTFLEVSGASYPNAYKEQKIIPYEGRSLVPLLKGKTDLEQRPLYWEHEANRAIRVNQWKLVSKSTIEAPYIGPWELYNVETDKTETIDLAASHPEKVKELEQLWTKWAAEKNVFPLDSRQNKKQRKKELVAK